MSDRHTPLLHLIRCRLRFPAIRFFDPTGGDPWMGGPVWWAVCAACQERLTSRRAQRVLGYALRAARYREAAMIAAPTHPTTRTAQRTEETTDE